MRNYIVASWNDADQYDYSGQQIGNRLSQSQRVHFNPDGSACVASYSDDELTKRTTSIPLKDRILPQGKRVKTLTDQLIELEASYKADEMSIQEYTTLRSVLIVKRNRAQELYKKAVSVQEPTYSDEDDQESTGSLYKSNETIASCGKNGVKNDVSCQAIPQWLSSLSSSNCLKNPIINACKVWNKTVQLSQAARNYIQTLKEL